MPGLQFTTYKATFGKDSEKISYQSTLSRTLNTVYAQEEWRRLLMRELLLSLSNAF